MIGRGFGLMLVQAACDSCLGVLCCGAIARRGAVLRSTELDETKRAFLRCKLANGAHCLLQQHCARSGDQNGEISVCIPPASYEGIVTTLL